MDAVIDAPAPTLAAAAVVVVAWFLFVVSRRWAQPDDCGRLRTVVVTGAGSGLGLACVERLLRAGDRVAALDLKPTTALTSLRRDQPEALLVVSADVTAEEAVAAAAGSVAAWAGAHGVDAVLNFAGVISTGPLCELDQRDFTSCLDVNVAGTWRVNRAFLGLLSKSPAPRIVNLSSEVGANLSAIAFNGPYSVTKWAIEAYCHALRQELAMMHPPVAVVALCPGAYTTDMTQRASINSFLKYANRPGTRHAAALKKGAMLSAEYIERYGRPPSELADAVHTLVHCRAPPARLCINNSWSLWIVSLLPRSLLDAAVHLQFS